MILFAAAVILCDLMGLSGISATCDVILKKEFWVGGLGFPSANSYETVSSLYERKENVALH